MSTIAHGGSSGESISSHGSSQNAPVQNGDTNMTEITSSLLSKNEWLQTQIDQHNVEVLAGKRDINIDSTNLAEEIPKLEEELFFQYAEKDKKEVIIKRMQLGKALVKELFEKQNDGSGDAGKHGNNTGYLEDLLERQCSLVTDIMKNVKAMETAREKLKDLKKANFDLLTGNRKKMHVIKEKNEANKRPVIDDETKELLEDLDQTVQKISIIRHTLQGLVIGSGINWAQDPETQEMVLQLGEKLDFI